MEKLADGLEGGTVSPLAGPQQKKPLMREQGPTYLSFENLLL